ncbi:MAG: hypothetical protein NWF04_08500 [Candidatus Bathyarchaeota archaeon]|nr:hypothetical protein [Candidatus Bathyarchaeota archaeon]
MKANHPLTAFLLTLLIAFSTVSFSPFAYSADSSAPERVLAFLTDVVLLDVEEYDVEVVVGPITEYPEDLNKLSLTHGLLSFSAENSLIEVLFRFVNGTLTSCKMDVRKGMPIYSQPQPSSMNDLISGFLERYQSLTKDSSISDMHNMVKSLDLSENATKTSGNITLEVSLTSTSTGSSCTSFRWSNTYGGAVFSTLGIRYRDGDFYLFGDDRSYVQIGSTAVNVSKEDAVDLALAKAADFSYTFDNQEIKNLKVFNDGIKADLLTTPKDVALVLFPYWKVELPLCELYPGFVSLVVVELWADSGEVFAVYPLGIGGGDLSSSEPTPSLSPTPLQTLTPTPTLSPTPTNTPPLTGTPQHTSSLPSSPVSASPTQPTSHEGSVSPSIDDSENSFVSTSTFVLVMTVVLCVLLVAGLVMFRRRYRR